MTQTLLVLATACAALAGCAQYTEATSPCVTRGPALGAFDLDGAPEAVLSRKGAADCAFTPIGG